MRLDAVLRGMGPAAMARCATAADSASAPVTLWLPESPGDRQSFATAMYLLARSSKTRLATGVMPIPMRSAVDVLAAALTIAEAFPGRFDLGVGSGNVMSLRKAGIEVEPPPLTVARTFLDTWAGLVGRSGVAALLDLPSTVELPAVLLAAHNQQMISLAMRRADGLILNMVPASDLVATLRHVRNASERAGRASRPAQVGMFQLAAFGPHDAALAAARLVLAGFCRAPAVRKRLHSFHSRHADTADRVADLPPTADAAALVELMPADMVEDFAVTSEAALAERIGLAADLGVDFVALSVFPVPLRLRKSFPPVPEEEAAEQATVEAITIIDQLTRSSGVVETTAMAAEASV